MLMHHGHFVETTHVVEVVAEGVLLLFPTTTLSYDEHHYGNDNLVAMSVADSPNGVTCANSLRRPNAHEAFWQHSIIKREKMLDHCPYVHYALNL
jgi:hypothetical protein